MKPLVFDNLIGDEHESSHGARRTAGPTILALRRIAVECESRYKALVADGCDPDVAADRTFDALRAATGEVKHAYDSRDRLFENKLRAIAAEGN